MSNRKHPISCPVPGEEVWEYAGWDSSFVQWLSELSELCVRLLGADYFDIVTEVSEGEDERAYAGGISPEHFFLEIIDSLQMGYGADYIDDVVGGHLMWGYHFRHQ